MLITERQFQEYEKVREQLDILAAIEEGRREFAGGGGKTIEELEAQWSVRRRTKNPGKPRARRRSKTSK